MIKLVSETIDQNDINKLIEWLQTNPRLTKGPLTPELEQKWADYIGTKHAVFVNSGSSSIFLSLLALKTFRSIKKVAVPALSWATDVSSPMILGLETILVDCNLHDLSVDLEDLERVFKEDSPDALIVVSVLGFPPDLDSIVALCEKYNVLLIEDNCESMGTKYKGRMIGTAGIASLYSTYFGHHISTIEGGFINTNDTEFYNQLLMLRSHGWGRDLSSDRQAALQAQHNISEFDALYTFYVPGMNVRSTDLQAFIGINSIDKLDGFSKTRNKNFFHYEEKLGDYNQFNFKYDGFVSNFAYPVLTDDKEEVYERVKGKVEIRPLIAGNVGRHPMCSGLKQRELPNANLVHEKGIYLPNHQDLTFEEIDYIADLVMGNKK
jgi:CDP-6-deoxy-D-xylo-4-hexulose-3-dehydrase